MLKTFEKIAPFIKFNEKKVKIDNIVFKLHYRWTFLFLLVASILVTSTQYIGDPIKCISDAGFQNVINTFCFFTPTFTLVRHLNNSALEAGLIFQPGIGPHETKEEPIKRYAYYQWVSLVLFLQALCFYVPHALWKEWEGGKIRALVFGLKMVGISRYLKKEGLKVGKLEIPSRQAAELRVKDIRRTLVQGMRYNQTYGKRYVVAEFLNYFNLLTQIYLTNLFLAGEFYSLGLKILDETWTNEMDVLDVVFPKVTKCNFQKYGPGGSLQIYDTLCVMALNIINEKIFTILWFWYSVVLIVSTLGLIWRGLTIFMFKSKLFNRHVFSYARPGKYNRQDLFDVVRRCNFSSWMFLFFLACNLSEFLFEKIISNLADEFKMQPQYGRHLEETKAEAKNIVKEDNFDQIDSPLMTKKAIS